MMLEKLVRRFGRKSMPTEGSFDVYVVSYPKCGATWTRVLLGKYVQLITGSASLPLFDGALYDPLVAQITPRIKFTHQPLLWDRQRAADLNPGNTIAPFGRAKVILIVRYPLDALLSSHAQWTNQLGATMDDLQSFLVDPIHGIEKLLKFHQLWAKHRTEVREFLSVRYEGMLQSAPAEMRRLLTFVGLPVDEALLAQAVAFASFDSMRKMQISPDVPVYPTSGLPIFGSIDVSNPATFLVRRGVAGGYRDFLSPAQYEPLEELIAREMDPIFGYQRPPCAA
jgi:hypothetical protein